RRPRRKVPAPRPAARAPPRNAAPLRFEARAQPPPRVLAAPGQLARHDLLAPIVLAHHVIVALRDREQRIQEKLTHAGAGAQPGARPEGRSTRPQQRRPQCARPAGTPDESRPEGRPEAPPRAARRTG